MGSLGFRVQQNLWNAIRLGALMLIDGIFMIIYIYVSSCRTIHRQTYMGVHASNTYRYTHIHTRSTSFML